MERLRRSSISQLYFSDMTRIMNFIKPHLPTPCERILDIGCGLGGISVLLFHEYLATNRQIELWMLDKNDDSPLYERHYAGFRDVAAAYNSLQTTQRFLEANGVQSQYIHLINIERDKFPSTTVFDVIVSLLSWGFHFPVDAYLAEVTQSLKSSGVLFIDVRKHTDGIEKLKSVFSEVNILYEGKKHFFVCASKSIER